MPNIREIVPLSSEARPGGVRLHNEWAGKGDIPRVVQGLITPDMVKWDDFADWDDAEGCCTWRIATRVFTDHVRCAGTNRFAEVGPSATRVTLAGELELDLRDIPGVPRLLAGRLTPQVERFIIALITPNLVQVNESLARYLDADSRST